MIVREDVNWQEKRILVGTAKKTKRSKSSQWVPLLPELEPFLLAAFVEADSDATFCIERYRTQDVNLRTHFQRIIKKAGVKAWPRLWYNLRASRETELANEFPIHVVAEWLGNSPVIAAKHYLRPRAKDECTCDCGPRLTEAHF